MMVGETKPCVIEISAHRYSVFHLCALLISARNEPQASGAPVPGAPILQNNLGGRMPLSFDQDVARVVADVDRIEAETLGQMDRSALDRQDKFAPWGSCCSSISASRPSERSMQFLPYAGDRIHRADTIFE